MSKIDLKQFEGHTSSCESCYSAQNDMCGPYLADPETSTPCELYTLYAGIAKNAGAILAYARELETERDSLTKTNNSLVDTVTELRAEVAEYRLAAITAQNEVISLREIDKSHAAALAGALSELQDDPDWDMFFNRCFCDSLIERDRPCRFCAARAALAAYNKTQGDDTNAKR